jgi:hypothetical protein
MVFFNICAASAEAANVEVVNYICKTDTHTLYVGTSVIDEAMLAISENAIPIYNTLSQVEKIKSCAISKNYLIVVKINVSPNGRYDTVKTYVNGSRLLGALSFSDLGHSYGFIITDYSEINITYFESEIRTIKQVNVNSDYVADPQ